MTATSGMVAGQYQMWIAKRDSNGYPVGTAGTADSPAQNTIYGAYVINHAVSFTPPQPTVEEATWRGGQTIRGKRHLGVSDYGTGQLVLSAFDETFHALVSKSSLDETTVIGPTISAANSVEATSQQFVIGLSTGFTTASGTDEYMTYVLHNVTISPVYPSTSQDGGVNPNTLTYELTMNTSSRTGIGRLISGMAFNITETTDTMMAIRSTSRYHVASMELNGSGTTLTLPYRPVSSAADGGTANSITHNGTTHAVSSVSTTTGAVVLANTGSAGDMIVIAYPTNYIAP